MEEINRDNDLEDQELEAMEVLPQINEAIEPEKPKILKRLEPSTGFKYDFKEYSETKYMYDARIAILAKLENLRLKSGVLTSQELQMISRMINNKIWYNVVYDKDSESYLKYIINMM
jgi:hypothetical protein